MKVAKLTHRGHFDASHFLPGFGKCERNHGHTYIVEITVAGEIGPKGVVLDFSEIKSAYMGLDHTCLNDWVELPTAENIAHHILFQVTIATNRVDHHISEIYVKLWEGKNNSAEVGCSFT